MYTSPGSNGNGHQCNATKYLLYNLYVHIEGPNRPPPPATIINVIFIQLCQATLVGREGGFEYNRIYNPDPRKETLKKTPSYSKLPILPHILLFLSFNLPVSRLRREGEVILYQDVGNQRPTRFVSVFPRFPSIRV